MEKVTENKLNIDEIDKQLVAENKLYFSNGNNTEMFKLTEDGIIEKYLNENLQMTFPFSKLGLTRECKTLVGNGYSLIRLNEAEVNDVTATGENNNVETGLDLDNPEKTKQELQQNIKDVEEIQDLKDELEDKMANLMEDVKPDDVFPSTEFTQEPMYYEDINVETFNDQLTTEQKIYINTYLGTIDDIVNAMLMLYEEVGDTTQPMISLDDYVKELLEYDGIDDWEKELADMLGIETPEENLTENKSKFYTADNMFDDFVKTAKEESEDGVYEFKISDLGLTKEDTANFKNLLLQRPEIEDVSYDPATNLYSVKISNDVKVDDEIDDKAESEEKSTEVEEPEKEEEKDETKLNEAKIEETNNLSRLYQHTKDKDTFAIIGSQDQDTKQDRSNELKSEIGKAQKQFSNVGYNRLEGTYTYENGEQGIENSFIIYNIPKDTALNIANKLNQESIIWKDDSYFGFLKADGTEDGQFKNQDRNMTFDDKITNMFGSRFKNGSNRLAFAFECKLIETTATGSNFSKQDRANIVEFPVCRIDVPRTEE